MATTRFTFPEIVRRLIVRRVKDLTGAFSQCIHLCGKTPHSSAIRPLPSCGTRLFE